MKYYYHNIPVSQIAKQEKLKPYQIYMILKK